MKILSYYLSREEAASKVPPFLTSPLNAGEPEPDLSIKEEDPDRYRDYELRLVRFRGRVIEAAVTDSDSAVRRWLRYMARDHRRRRGPLVAGLTAYPGLPLGFSKLPWRIQAHPPPANAPGNPIRTLVLCLGGAHCLIFSADPYDRFPPVAAALQMFLGDRRISVVGVGMASTARKIEADLGIAIANPVDLRDLAAGAVGKEKVFEVKKKGKWLVVEGLELEKLAELVLGADLAVGKKPASVVESCWPGRWWDPDLEEDRIMYGAVDAFLSFEIGLKCLQITGGRTA